MILMIDAAPIDAERVGLRRSKKPKFQIGLDAAEALNPVHRQNAVARLQLAARGACGIDALNVPSIVLSHAGPSGFMRERSPTGLG